MKFDSETLFLIYDGDCPLCRNTAMALRLKKSVKNMELINARQEHPLLSFVLQKGINLNEGIIVLYQRKLLHGADALTLISLLTTPSGWMNRISAVVFRVQWANRFLYPVLKGLRWLLLQFRRNQPIPITPTQSLYDDVFQMTTEAIPTVFKKRYELRYHCTNKVTLNGKLNVFFSGYYRLMAPFFRMAGAFFQQEGTEIPTTVQLNSHKESSVITMNRCLHYTQSNKQYFESHIRCIKNNQLVEITGRRIAWKFRCSFSNGVLKMHHRGYGVMLNNRFVRIPFLEWIVGWVEAEEKALDVHSISSKITVSHLFSKILMSYEGVFSLSDR